MNLPLFAGVALATVAWGGLSAYGFATSVLQGARSLAYGTGARTGMDRLVHEGITIAPQLTLEAKQHALRVMDPVFGLFLAVFAAGMAYRWLDRDGFQDIMAWFYGIELALASALISFPVWTGTLDAEQLFFIGHSFHSILTVGTVLILDFVLMVTMYSETYEVNLYPVLPDISKVIWLGLALEFASVAFVFDQAIAFTPKLLFMQTVIGVIILNGVFLSGPMTQKMISTITGSGTSTLSRRWELAAGVSGSVSMVSWLTVTFVDLLHGTTASYATFLSVYIAFIAVAFVGYEFMEHYKVGARL
jgi:hypothetical protein